MVHYAWDGGCTGVWPGSFLSRAGGGRRSLFLGTFDPDSLLSVLADTGVPSDSPAGYGDKGTAVFVFYDGYQELLLGHVYGDFLYMRGCAGRFRVLAAIAVRGGNNRLYTRTGSCACHISEV